MKSLIILFFAGLASTGSLAAEGSAYQVVYRHSEKGKVVHSGSLILLEDQRGELKSGSGSDIETLSAIVKPSADKQHLLVDYHFKEVKDGKTFEFGKGAVALSPGETDANDVKDAGGRDFELKVTVSKR